MEHDQQVYQLDEDACRTLLAEQTIGRVAFMGEHFPTILPVNYVMFDGLIVLRTDPGSKLTLLPLRPAAFEIDGTTSDSTTGDAGAWSVVVQGHAREVTTALGDRYDRLRATEIELLSPGDKAHWIAIEIEHVSGRRLPLKA